MTFEVQQTRWDRIIRRVSGSIGPGSRVGETLSELFPVLDVERVPGELLVLGGTRIAFGGASFQSTAGNFPIIMLFNPADSGNIATVTTLIMVPSNSTTAALRWGPILVQAGALIGTETFRDLRLPLTTRPVCQISTQSAAGVGGGTASINALANIEHQVQDENGVMVLAPGSGLEVSVGKTATTLGVVFYWRERPAEPSELSV